MTRVSRPAHSLDTAAAPARVSGRQICDVSRTIAAQWRLADRMSMLFADYLLMLPLVGGQRARFKVRCCCRGAARSVFASAAAELDLTRRRVYLQRSLNERPSPRSIDASLSRAAHTLTAARRLISRRRGHAVSIVLSQICTRRASRPICLSGCPSRPATIYLSHRAQRTRSCGPHHQQRRRRHRPNGGLDYALLRPR